MNLVLPKLIRQFQFMSSWIKNVISSHMWEGGRIFLDKNGVYPIFRSWVSESISEAVSVLMWYVISSCHTHTSTVRLVSVKMATPSTPTVSWICNLIESQSFIILIRFLKKILRWMQFISKLLCLATIFIDNTCIFIQPIFKWIWPVKLDLN